MRDELPVLKEDLIREFRGIVHPIPWWQKVVQKVQKVFPNRTNPNPPQQ
jgi:cobalamin biosynthesis protein CobD/CbiB